MHTLDMNGASDLWWLSLLIVLYVVAGHIINCEDSGHM